MRKGVLNIHLLGGQKRKIFEKNKEKLIKGRIKMKKASSAPAKFSRSLL